MPRAIVLINVSSAFEDSVLKEVLKLDNVEEAYVSYGVYDVVAKINASAMEDLKRTITQKIRTTKNVCLPKQNKSALNPQILQNPTRSPRSQP